MATIRIAGLAQRFFDVHSQIDAEAVEFFT